MRRPSQYSKDPEERHLWGLLSNYINPHSRCYRPEFKKWLDENCPSNNNPTEKVKRIKKFMEDNGRRPGKRSKDPEEKRLAIWMWDYTVSSAKNFNPEFRKWLDENYPSNVKTPAERVSQMKEFIEINGRRPSQASKNLEEKRLGALMSNYTTPSNPSFNPELKKWLDENYPSKNNPVKKVKILKEFIQTNGRRPSKASKDPVEKKLRYAMATYISPASPCFNPEFRKWLDENCPSTQVRAQKSIKPTPALV